MFTVFENNIIFILLIFLISIIIDLIYGELPVKIHPVVLIGNLIDFFKNRLIKYRNRFSGFVLSICVYLISGISLFVLFKLFSLNYILLIIFSSIILSTTYSVKLLLSSAKDIENKLNEDINKARESVSYLVSRNTDTLDESFIVSATIETLSENITDSYVSPIFYYFIFAIFSLFIVNNNNLNFIWFILILIPFLYRIANSMDAMLGYTTDELIYIGYVPAKVDDILNYIPSRFCSLIVVLSAYLLKYNYKNAFSILKRDAKNCPSPNSGYTMAPTAGALDIQLIKKDTYTLGDNKKSIVVSDISKALKLSKMTIFLFTLFIIILFIGFLL